MRSMMVPVPREDPQHIEMKAVVLSLRSSSWSAVTIKREPVAPTGWPSAMAPPLTLSLSTSASYTPRHDSTTLAKA